jgi:hypothetical protein
VGDGTAGAVAFERVRPAWRALGGGARYFFQTLQWVEALAPHAGPDAAWGAAFEGGLPSAVTLLRRRSVAAGGLKIRLLTEHQLPAIPPFADCLIRADGPNPLRFDALLDSLGPWHALRLMGVRAESPWLRLAPERVRALPEPGGGAGIFETAAPFDARMQALPKSMRDALRKARNRLGARGRFAVATGPNILAAYDAFVALEAAGWKGAAGTALAQTPYEHALLRDYLRTAEAAEIRTLDIDGRLAAAQIGAVAGETFFLMKIAYDESLAHVAPGNLLMADLIERCCNDPAIRRIDCTVWKPWHERWGMRREPTYQVVAFNRRSARGLLAELAWNVFTNPRTAFLSARMRAAFRGRRGP